MALIYRHSNYKSIPAYTSGLQRCDVAQARQTGYKSVRRSARGHEPRKPRDHNRACILDRNDKISFTARTISQHWIAGSPDACGEGVAVNPFGHQKLKLVLQAHTDEQT